MLLAISSGTEAIRGGKRGARFQTFGTCRSIIYKGFQRLEHAVLKVSNVKEVLSACLATGNTSRGSLAARCRPEEQHD